MKFFQERKLFITEPDPQSLRYADTMRYTNAKPLTLGQDQVIILS